MANQSPAASPLRVSNRRQQPLSTHGGIDHQRFLPVATGFLPNFVVQGSAGAPFRYIEICMENDADRSFGSSFSHLFCISVLWNKKGNGSHI